LDWRIQYDFQWVMENLITILSKDTNRPARFVLNRPQLWPMWLMLDDTARGRPVRHWWLKGRQFGYSTFWVTVMFICTALRGQNSLVLAHRESAGKSIFRKAEMARKSMPEFQFQASDEDGNPVGPVQVVALVPPPDSTLKESLLGWLTASKAAVLRRDSAENRDAGVGETFQNAQLTEVPLYPDAKHTLSAFFPTLSDTPNTFVGAEFTARNEGDYAHTMYLNAQKPGSIFRAGFASWTWHEPYKSKKSTDGVMFTPEEQDYRDMVRQRGYEYPLTPEGRLIPRLHALWVGGKRLENSDLATGTVLSDAQLLFRREMLDYFSGDVATFRREFPATPEEAFAQARRTLIPPNVMEKMELNRKPPLEGERGVGEYIATQGKNGKSVARWMPSRTGRVWRWEMPLAGQTYMVFFDPSSGAGVDPSGGGVLRINYQKVTLVASFLGFERPHDIARIAARMGRHYRDFAALDSVTKKVRGGQPCEIALERNGFGEAVIHELTNNLNYMKLSRYTDRSKDNWSRGHDYGFPTSKSNKVPMLLDLARGAYDEQLIVPCERTLQHLRAIQYIDDEDQKIAAPRGQHDDLAMAIGIGFHFAQVKPAFRHKPAAEVPEWARGNDRGFDGVD
jgi:hypothetical protein